MSKNSIPKPSFVKRSSNGFKGWQNIQDDVGVSQIMNLLQKQQQTAKFSQAIIRKNIYGNFIKNRSSGVFKNRIISQNKERKSSLCNSDNVKVSKQNTTVLLKQYQGNKNQTSNKMSNQHVEVFQPKENNKVRKRSIKVIKHERPTAQRTSTLISEQSMSPFDTLKEKYSNSLQKKMKAVTTKAQNSIETIYERIMVKQQKLNLKTEFSYSNNPDVNKSLINTILLKGREMKFENTFKLNSARNRKTHRSVNCDKDLRKQNCITNSGIPVYQGSKKTIKFDKCLNKASIDKQIKLGNTQYQNSFRKNANTNTQTLLSGNSIFQFGDGPIFEVLLNSKKF